MYAKWAALFAVLLPATAVGSLRAPIKGVPLFIARNIGARILANAAPPTPLASEQGASMSPLAPLGGASAKKLAPIVVHDWRVPDPIEVQLYDASNHVDPDAVHRLRTLLGEGVEAPIRERTIQLVMKAAYHFGGAKVDIISSIRKGRRQGPHASGAAIDFQLVGVPASKLASFLRKEPRVGVGIYTHPKTQFVHIDDRDISFHWIDASPPGKTWRERALKDPTRDVRDATYVPEMDLPEALRQRD